VSLKYTVITVTYNAELTIEGTLNSVINQSYKNLEYIIIDGKSNDKTASIIQKYSNKIKYWESTPDNGIYDAMNKGILKSDGDFICFMNAGDEFANDDVLLNISNIKNLKNFKLLYGDTIVKNRSRLYCAKDIKKINYGTIACHQSMVFNKNLFSIKLFNTNFHFASDYDYFYYTHINYPNQVLYLNYPISIVTTDGYSAKNSIETYKEFKQVVQQYNKSFIINYFYVIKIMERRIIYIIKKLFNIHG
jgi:glycosyltransferase involved in cell wall biosynthesis